MISIINYQAKRLFTTIAIFIVIISASKITQAQEQNDNAVLRQEFEQAFQLMMQDPSNVDNTMKYAHLAVSLNNYEAAIPPLERVLMFNPNLPKIKLELGVLYYKLDSMKMAKSYFDDVLVSKDASAEMKQSATEYLQQIKG